MNKTIENILVPVDFSPYSTEALLYAATLADHLASTVVVLHVIAKEIEAQAAHQRVGSGVPLSAVLLGLTLTSEALGVPPEMHEAVVVDLRERAQTALQHFLPSELSGRSVELRVEIGHPFEQILEVAKGERVDMIVMGTHGRTGLAHIVLGSVAERVVRMAPCPVLTVKAPPSTE